NCWDDRVGAFGACGRRITPLTPVMCDRAATHRVKESRRLRFVGVSMLEPSDVATTMKIGVCLVWGNAALRMDRPFCDSVFAANVNPPYPAALREKIGQPAAARNTTAARMMSTGCRITARAHA